MAHASSVPAPGPFSQGCLLFLQADCQAPRTLCSEPAGEWGPLAGQAPVLGWGGLLCSCGRILEVTGITAIVKNTAMHGFGGLLSATFFEKGACRGHIPSILWRSQGQ